MKKSRFRHSIVLLALSAAMVCGSASCSSDSTEITNPVGTYTLEHCTVENYISVSGKVEGSDILKVTSEVNTKIKALNVEIGGAVKKGDILCVFDSTDFQSEYDSLVESLGKSDERLRNTHEINQRNLDNAKADRDFSLQQAQRAVDNAVDACNRAYARYNETVQKCNDYYDQYSEYYSKAYVDEKNFDETAYMKSQEYYELYMTADAECKSLEEQLSSYDNAVQDAEDAYSTVQRNSDSSVQSAQDVINSEKFDNDDSVQKQLNRLAEKIEKCTIRADRDGIVTSLNVAEGSIPTSEALMTIENNSKLRINVTINEADILNVHEGQKAIITTTATGDREFEGTVSRVVNIMSGQSNNLLTGENSGGGYSAEIVIDSNDSNLLIGMSAKAKIILDKKENVLAVPYDALAEDEDGFYVFTAKSQGDTYTAEKVMVEMGMESNYLTEIISSRLSDGDLIITSPSDVNDGDSVSLADSFYQSQDIGE